MKMHSHSMEDVTVYRQAKNDKKWPNPLSDVSQFALTPVQATNMPSSCCGIGAAAEDANRGWCHWRLGEDGG